MADEPIPYAKNTFDWWRAACRGEKVPMHDIPMQGFYGYRPSKDAAPLPVAIWYTTGGNVVGTLGAEDGKPKPAESAKIVELWTRVMRHPISKKVFDNAVAGEPWPNEVRIEFEDGTIGSTMIGDNSGTKDDVTMLGNIREWRDQLARLLKKGPPGNKDEADALSDLSTKLRDLCKEADGRRKALTQPHRDAEQEINDLWQPQIKGGQKDCADGLAAVNVWIDREQAKRDAEALALRQKIAEETAKSADLAGTPAPSVRVEAIKVTGGTRRTVAQVNVTYVDYGEDPKKGLAMAMAYLAENTPAEVADVVDKALLRLLRAGAPVPGVKLGSRKTAR